MQEQYHIPVMLKETIESLEIEDNGIYVDVTFGGGGHSREILSKLKTGILVAVDQDEDAQKKAEQFADNPNFIFVKSNFKYIKNFLRYYKIEKVDGILADLGVSSYQFDTQERGFSFRFNGKLDMRMNHKSKLTAQTIVNEYDEDRLLYIFRNYGELENARKISRLIVKFRELKQIETAEDLKEALKQATPAFGDYKFWAKVYQAIRIEVNQELEALKLFLKDTPNIIKEGGLLVIMTYHSLEDRIVKNFIKTGNVEGIQEKDFFGNVIQSFRQTSNKIIVPTEEELEKNPRARSAKLRVAKKI